MHSNLGRGIILLAFAALLAAIVCGVLSSIESISPRKGRLRFAGVILFGSFFCLLGIGQFVYVKSLPVLNAEGTIESATVHPQGRSYRTDFIVTGPDGATYQLKADGRSNFFRAGEHVILTYRGYSGSVVKAHFINGAGAEEGIFQSAEGFALSGAIFVGCILFWAGYKKYRRDPQGAEVNRR
jgi:hypothetical protein